MFQDTLFDPTNRKEVDEWIERRKQEDKRIIEKEVNIAIVKEEKKKAINKSIEALNDLALYIKNQHMLEDTEGKITQENIEIYKARFIGLKLGANALKKQIKLMERIEKLEKENRYSTKMVRELQDMLKEILIV